MEMSKFGHEILEVRVDREFLVRLDDFRWRQPDAPSRAEALRRLVGIALAVGRATPAGQAPLVPRSRRRRRR
jgi:hypothetical protein